MGADDPAEPLRRTHVPAGAEYLRSPGEYEDPLAEDGHAPVPGLVHRYPDRALFLTTAFCSTYCRYCTRSRMVGEVGGDYHFSLGQWERALGYVEAHPEIRDVLVSGGDPLTLGDEKLDWLLGRLRRIRHVEFLRVGTKVPVVLPQRVTRAFARMMRRHRPWLSLHFTHPAELTPEATEACARLADAGLPLGSQTVLLKGVNDSVDTLKELFHGLLARRVKPYYLFQCDPITGSAHFRTPVERGLEIIRGLRGHTTGYAVPHFVVDLPGGGGKVPLSPDYLLGRDGDDLLFRNFEGEVHRYADPGGRLGFRPRPGEPADARRPHLRPQGRLRGAGPRRRGDRRVRHRRDGGRGRGRAAPPGLPPHRRPDRQRLAADGAAGEGRALGPRLQHRGGPARPLARGAGAGTARGVRDPLHLRRPAGDGRDPRQGRRQADRPRPRRADRPVRRGGPARRRGPGRPALPGLRQAGGRGHRQGDHAALEGDLPARAGGRSAPGCSRATASPCWSSRSCPAASSRSGSWAGAATPSPRASWACSRSSCWRAPSPRSTPT
jgi:lysine 2,3-aminomutase